MTSSLFNIVCVKQCSVWSIVCFMKCENGCERIHWKKPTERAIFLRWVQRLFVFSITKLNQTIHPNHQTHSNVLWYRENTVYIKQRWCAITWPGTVKTVAFQEENCWCQTDINKKKKKSKCKSKHFENRMAAKSSCWLLLRKRQ